MISLLAGKIVLKTNDAVVLLTSGGVGYEVRVSSSFLGILIVDQEVHMYTYLRVTDSDLSLFGFRSVDERSFFELLLSVSGVGPKSAMNVLNLGSIGDIQSAIARSDVKYLTAVQGMGKKTAERVVLELRSKMGASPMVSEEQPSGQVLSDVIDGLIAMGYEKQDAIATARHLVVGEKTAEVLLREALGMMSKR
ncbi:MAG: Holliday junction branch migration protein RuvA [Candidatus Magasanikbacteria bacterium]|uniref:Holliday junction branch migration complex subunit RuvA n=1 Tax=Candidatus Magasanikbacteria bacterium CG10_big_fil_rev_8_21_14_0_10_38_6 TaxID=1974647 RepID=A0A2M6P0G4_9BACT|nr:Holliday junction branch migration protein RuvA [Candidatus Magasanikbacteria bacterium]NCS71992.1 Holliday junction branch migration protein RuvA [Candidatus Magasanikbacteria bacterium]PIR77049.1 MAG: Holliday junction branch migration protein RuvA [Candidatus Magasanikbacteria bacterium CG10_big_fil_rev_8_21_14_0_10_38_6]